MQMAESGECSKRSLQLVRGIAPEVEEQGAALLLTTLEEQCFEQLAQLSERPLVIAVVVAVCLLSVGLPMLAQIDAAPVRSQYPRWHCRERRVSQLTENWHVRSAGMSLRKREGLDAGGWALV
jgi:hypothetical protein